ncbi:MAG: hypothetical protein ACI4SA_01665 [Lachnospiraceae bacterium]
MEKKMKEAFWKREEEANHTRKKPLNDLPYITIPLHSLPLTGDPDTEEIREYRESIKALASCKIVNFTGYTNTDLKLTYGTANITLLSEYDQNYTFLVSTLQKWAEALYREGAIAECRQVLEYAVSIGTDVSHTYYLLADLYDDSGDSLLKEDLIKKASAINSTQGSIIARTLQGSGPYSGWLHSA